MKHGLIRIFKNRLVIEAPPHVSIRLRRNFGGIQRYQAGQFTLSATPEQAYDLEWFRQRYPLDVDPECEVQYRALCAAHERKLAAIAAIDEAGYVPREFELALPPREYQRVAADLALKTGSLLVGDVIGLGKTVTCICALTAPGSLPALVITMTHLARQWERELARFAPTLRVHRIRKGQPYSFTDIRVEKDPTTKRRKVVKYSGVPDVLIITYSKLHGWVESLAGIVRAVIMDEVQEFRHEDTRKYKAGLAIAQQADLRIGASASPIYNYGAEIFNVMGVVAPGQLGTRKEFLDEWCGGTQTQDGKASVQDPAALGTYLRESGLMIRRTRKDVGREIPPCTMVRHAVECDPDSLSKASADVAELARRVLNRIGTAEERMRQAGELDWRMRQATGIAKAGAIADFVRLLVESGECVVLYAWHRAVYDLICASFDRPGAEISYAMYTGQESDVQKDASRQRFISGDAKVLIISLRSGAGLDGLQFVCCNVVVGELDWSPKVIEQGVGRVHRDGQTEPVMAYVLVADEGSDPVISDVLGIKEAQSVGIMDPDAAEEPVLTGASDDHIRKLAESILKKRGHVVDN